MNWKVSYGGIEAVKGITFEVPERQIVTLIGANGAGKSTTLRTIAGLVKPAPRPHPSPGGGHHRSVPPTASSPRGSPWSPRDAGCFPTCRWWRI